MKNATKKVLDYFPMLEKHVPEHDSTLLSNETLSKLNETEQIFLRLIWFFENPDKENFNLESLYKEVDRDWLAFALEAIYSFFKNDTYLLDKQDFSMVTRDSKYLNQTEFANYLTENGLNYSRHKLHVYLNRGNIPAPDLTISNAKYWLLSTCDRFLNHEKQRMNDK